MLTNDNIILSRSLFGKHKAGASRAQVNMLCQRMLYKGLEHKEMTDTDYNQGARVCYHHIQEVSFLQVHLYLWEAC